MRVMVIIKATPSSEQGQLPSAELLTAMTAFNQSLLDAGLLLAGDGLKPSSAGARVHFSGSQRDVHIGPFVETTELIAGYWIWQVDSLEHALEWVKRCPNPMPEDSIVEVRPLYEMEDFAESDPTGEVRRTEAEMRTNL